MVTPLQIKQWIEEGLVNSEATVSGDGHHFIASIVCADFANKNRVQRHRMVYAVLGDRMREEIHALSLKTFTPQEVNET